MRDAHQSGRFDAPLTSKLLFAHDLRTTSTTAVVTEARKLILPCNWKGHGGETQVWWDTSYWELGTLGTYKIPTPKWFRGGDTEMINLPVPYVVLNHRIKKSLRFVRAGGHHPAHLFRKVQRQANDVIVEHLGTMLDWMKLQYGADTVTYSADFNLNLHSPGIQDWVKPAGYRLIVPPSNTFRLRTIDGALTTGAVGPVDMLPKYKGIDHRGFEFEVN